MNQSHRERDHLENDQLTKNDFFIMNYKQMFKFNLNHLSIKITKLFNWFPTSKFIEKVYENIII